MGLKLLVIQILFPKLQNVVTDTVVLGVFFSFLFIFADKAEMKSTFELHINRGCICWVQAFAWPLPSPMKHKSKTKSNMLSNRY